MSKAFVATWLFFGLFLCSCERRAKENRPKAQELRFNLKFEPLSIDPRKPNDATSASFVKMCFDGLMRFGLDGKPHNALAERFEISEDKKIYTFFLREALWSDGQPVTAYDFETTMKTILDPAFPSEAASDLFVIKNAKCARMKKCSVQEVGVAALDARTLRIELEHPTPSFLAMLATFSYLPTPQHIVSTHPGWADKQNAFYVSNGPFCLKEWRPMNYIILEKNPNYWDKESVKLDRIHLLIIDDENTELSMFNNGDLDWAGAPLSSLPLDALPSLRNVNTYQMAGIYYYICNTKDPLMQNANLRRALALSINRKAIIDNVTQSKQSVATSFIPPSLCSQDRRYFSDADIEGARAAFQLALGELNLTAEEFPSLTLSYNTLQSHAKIAQAIQQQWRDALGITVHLENKEWKVFLDEQRHHKFQVARMGGIANYYDPITFLDNYRYLSSTDNFSQWTNPAYTKLLERSDQTIDPDARMNILLEAEKILMDEMPILPIYFYTGSYLKKSYVKDVFLSELADIDFKWAYIDAVSP
ncbi:MAG TPA: peptide ABC transporter substrate-binding protein [Rhabdochlamydiaceae bacterium]|jgi:oligopeptide transport system substrate-binding protein